MRKVYADKRLPYDQTTRFEFPDGLDLCDGAYVATSHETAAESEEIEGIFE
jgi:hypothetical protein